MSTAAPQRTAADVAREIEQTHARMVALQQQQADTRAALDRARAERVTALVTGASRKRVNVGALEGELDGLGEALEHLRGHLATLEGEAAGLERERLQAEAERLAVEYAAARQEAHAALREAARTFLPAYQRMRQAGSAALEAQRAAMRAAGEDAYHVHHAEVRVPPLHNAKGEPVEPQAEAMLWQLCAQLVAYAPKDNG